MPDAKLAIEMMPIADQAMASALLMEPCTFQELYIVARRACGEPAGDPCYRYADRWLQRLRRQGHANFTRSGRQVFWTYTPAGFATLDRMSRVKP